MESTTKNLKVPHFVPFFSFVEELYRAFDMNAYAPNQVIFQDVAPIYVLMVYRGQCSLVQEQGTKRTAKDIEAGDYAGIEVFMPAGLCSE